MDAARSASVEEWDLLGRDDVSDFNEENVLPQSSEDQSKIRAWLRPTEYDGEGGEYKKHSASHLVGTGNWLFSTEAYDRWHSSKDHGLLWIRGIPGSGKSVFAASIINRLRQEEVPVLYFFFRQIIDANHSPIAAVRDMLAQLLPFSPPLQQVLKEYIDNNRNLDSISSEDLWRHLRLATIYIPRTYWIVDALDEMDKTKDLEPFLRSVADFGSWRPAQVKVVVTSRPVAYIEDPLRTARTLHIRLEEREVDVDIATYVQHILSKTTIPTELQDRIRAAVPGNANGLFLYARLAMDAFIKPGADIPQVLEQLPQDLNVMYTDLLREHSRRSGVRDDIQLLILRAVTYATRPLRLLEIAEFLNVTQFPPEMRDLGAAKSLVRSACGPLLEILPDETVSVVHHSLTEFLNGSTRQYNSNAFPILKPGPTHHRLGSICLSYLVSGVLEYEETTVERVPRGINVYANVSESLFRYPFLDYAARNWHVHIRKASLAAYDVSDMVEMIDELLNGKNKIRWAKHAQIEYGIGDSVTPLDIAVLCGLADYVGILLARAETDVNTRYCGSPLCLAAEKGHETIVELLLAAGARISDHRRTGHTPMILAASHNHPRIVKLFIDNGVSPFERVSLNNGCIDAHRHPWEESALSSACSNGHGEVVKIISKNIKKTQHANTMLWSAVRSGRPEMVKLVLEHPAVKVDVRDHGRTPLIAASQAMSVEIIKMLLEAGADPNSYYETKHYPHGENTPLHALAADNGRWSNGDGHSLERKMECFELLVAAGADVNRLDSKGNSVLHLVKESLIVRLLLDAGADPNITNKEGQTLLHTCDSEDIMQVLLADSSIDPERQQNDGTTPLLCALRRGKIEIALQLLDRGASTAAVDQRGAGVFHYASRLDRIIHRDDQSGFTKIPGLMQRVLECGGDPNLPDSKGQTALHELVGEYMREEVLQTLVKVGANLEARDHEGRTPLYTFMTDTRRNFEPGWEILLQAGAKPHAVDHKGRTLFHMLDLRELGERAPLYIAQGLDPKQTDYGGNTLWHTHAATLARSNVGNFQPEETPPEILRGLFKLGIDPVHQNYSGRTLLHELCRFPNGVLSSKSDVQQEYGSQAPANNQMEGMVDYVIKLYLASGAGVDASDNDGVTAIHLSSTHCEYNVRRLLAAGADPLKATYEGLTPLHLAARSRRPNIIALLLEWMKEKYKKEVILAAVNAQDTSYSGGTPLYYACLSGVVQSVGFLIDAGAKQGPEKAWRSSPWISCAEFEAECLNWPGYEYRGWLDYYAPTAGSVLLKDKHRSHGMSYRQYPPDRIDDILDLLLARIPPTLKDLNCAIGTAARNKSEYAVKCLTHKRKELFPEMGEGLCLDTKVCLARWETNRSVVLSHEDGHPSLHAFEYLMGVRDYDGATKALLSGGGLQADTCGLEILHDLVVGGFASVVRKVATKELVQQFDDWKIREPLVQKLNTNTRPDIKQPILYWACSVENPNMDVIRVLVEEIGVDINVKCMCENPDYRSENRYLPGQTPLHLLVQGSYFWQSALAMPYFLQKGANIEARDDAGLTPLLTALARMRDASFDGRVIRELLNHGANVNASSPRGRTCLGQAVGDPRIVHLLLENGAMVTFSAFECAIRCAKAEVLDVLLDHGGDPNIRETEEERQEAAQLLERAPLTRSRIYPSELSRIQDHELYPLDLAVQIGSDYGRDIETFKRIVQRLLDHGASPNAVYPGITTVMHRIIETGDVSLASLCIDVPSLNLEARDSNGYTLLHRACLPTQRNRELLQYQLMDRGADIRATSPDGSTVLHHLAGTFGTGLGAGFRVIQDAPGLLDQKNNEGQTALHCALRGRDLKTTNDLLSAGASEILPDADGNTPLHMIMAFNWGIDEDGSLSDWIYFNVGSSYLMPEIFKKLIVSGGADVNARNANGETPLFMYFHENRVHCASGWTERHVWPVDPSKMDSTVLAGDSKKYFAEIPVIDFLEAHGMDQWDVVNATGETLLHAVARAGDDNVDRFRFLMGKGLDPRKEDGQHRTALDVAAIVGNTDILALFQRDWGGAEPLKRSKG